MVRSARSAWDGCRLLAVVDGIEKLVIDIILDTMISVIVGVCNFNLQ
jgi:hypothetical protein